jgi:MYND finger protein
MEESLVVSAVDVNISSTNEVKSIEGEAKDLKKIDRHCAFCLVPVSADEVKICGKCHRRAYCSKECQVKDWTSNPSNLKFILFYYNVIN